jgi:hypothetical protein
MRGDYTTIYCIAMLFWNRSTRDRKFQPLVRDTVPRDPHCAGFDHERNRVVCDKRIGIFRNNDMVDPARRNLSLLCQVHHGVVDGQVHPSFEDHPRSSRQHVERDRILIGELVLFRQRDVEWRLADVDSCKTLRFGRLGHDGEIEATGKNLVRQIAGDCCEEEAYAAKQIMPHVCSRCRFSFSAKIGAALFEFHGAPNCFVFPIRFLLIGRAQSARKNMHYFLQTRQHFDHLTL